MLNHDNKKIYVKINEDVKLKNWNLKFVPLFICTIFQQNKSKNNFEVPKITFKFINYKVKTTIYFVIKSTTS